MSETTEITKKDVLHLAELARFAISEEEAQELTGDLRDILEYVNEVQSLEGSEREMEHGTDEVNIFRDDEVTNQPNEFTERVLAQAPEREDSYVKVRKILE